MKFTELFESKLYKFHAIDDEGVKFFVTNSANLEMTIPTMVKYVERNGRKIEVSLDGKKVGEITKKGFQKLNEAQSMGDALRNTLSKAEPGSKLDKKIKAHNAAIKNGQKDSPNVLTSAPNGYHFDKSGRIVLGGK